MGSVNTTTVAKIFKILYPEGIEPLLYDQDEGSSLFAWLPKAYDFVGSQWNITTRINGTTGANEFGVSASAKGYPTYQTFAVTPTGEDYAHISIANKAIAASAQRKGALREAMQEAVDSAKYSVARSMANMLWGNGVGNRAVAGTIATVYQTLATLSDINRFEVGDELVYAATGSTSIASARTGSLTVTAIDRDSGKFTTDSNVTAQIPAAVATDLIFRKGDSAPFMGVFGWCPKADVTVTSTSFFGVDRTVDIVRLAGSRINGDGANMEDVIHDAIAKNKSHSGRGNVIWCNVLDFARLKKELAAYTTVDVKTDRANFSLRGISFESGSGPVAVIADRDCPQGHALLTNRKAWLLRGLRQLPHLADEDGRTFRMEAGADNVEAWLRCWGNLGCKRTLDNTAIKW